MKKKNLFFIVCSLLFLFCGCETNPDESTKNIVLDSIYISRKPAKLNYDYDEPLDLTGLVVTAKYSDGSEKNVEDWNSFPKPLTKLKAEGEVSVTISYEGKTVDFSVTVTAGTADVSEKSSGTEPATDGLSATGSNVAAVISGLTKAGDNKVYVVGTVSAENFTRINEALKSVSVNVILDFSKAEVATIPENAFKDCKMLKGLVIPDCVTSIGNFAFNGCTGLKDLKLEDGEAALTLGYNYTSYTGKGLFRDCPLENIYLGRNLEYADYNGKASDSNFEGYGYSAFANITTLQLSVEIGPKVKRIESYTFYGCAGLSVVNKNNTAKIKSIESNAFNGCSNLTDITIPETVTSFGDAAFKNCSSLSELTIPTSVTKIGEDVFNGCKTLKKLVIPKNVVNIGNYAFNGCKGLKDLKLEDGEAALTLGYNYTSYTGKGLFRDCPLENIYLGRNLEYAAYNGKASDSNFEGYGYSAFANIKTSPLSVEIGEYITSILPYTFYGCEGLTKVVTENSKNLVSIEKDSFNGCKNLSEIPIPETVTKLEDSAFKDCESLEELILPSILKKIGNSVFNGCKLLKELVIPESVNSIGNETFNGCTKLKKLTIDIGNEPLSLGYNYRNYTGKGLFRDCPLENLSVGRNIIYADYDDKSSNASYENYGYSAFADIITLSAVTINVPEDVTSFLIGKYAFKGCTGITSATFNKTDNWYSSASASMTDGTAVDVSDASKGAEVLKAMAENYLYWKNQ